MRRPSARNSTWSRAGRPELPNRVVPGSYRDPYLTLSGVRGFWDISAENSGRHPVLTSVSSTRQRWRGQRGSGHLAGVGTSGWRRFRSQPREPDRSKGDRQVEPLLSLWMIAQQAGHSGDGRAELVVSEGPDENAASVVATRFVPLPQQRSEVARIASHEDAVHRSENQDR